MNERFCVPLPQAALLATDFRLRPRVVISKNYAAFRVRFVIPVSADHAAYVPLLEAVAQGVIIMAEERRMLHRFQLPFFLVTLSSAVHAQMPQYLRLFFSLDNPVSAGHQPIPAPSGNHAANVVASPGNPLLSPSQLTTEQNIVAPTAIGIHRYHLWANGSWRGEDRPSQWWALPLGFQIDGPAQIVNGAVLNITNPAGWRRWETTSGADFDPTGAPADWNLYAISRTGVVFPPLNDGWDNAVNAVYLGYLDIQGNGGYSELRLVVGQSGIARHGGNSDDDPIYFGFSDAPLRGNDYGEVTVLPEIIIPEPNGAYAFVLCLAVSRRRQVALAFQRPMAFERRFLCLCRCFKQRFSRRIFDFGRVS
ncbi:MAG: hypothetical protein JNG88_10990 [Phycisphaerales bacterium]|nr:hypothetical protein [Phycisphaerales bacterium]